MVDRPTLAAAGCGLASALALLSGEFGGTAALILVYLTPLPLLAAGLGLGLTGGLIASGVGLVIITIGAGLLGALVYVVMHIVPSLIATQRALLSRADSSGSLEWYPPGLTMLWITIYAGSLMTIGMVLTMGEDGGLGGVMIRATGFDANLLGTTVPADGVNLATFVDMITRWLPGLSAMVAVLTIVINGALAQGVLARFNVNRRPLMEMSDFSVPRWVTIAFTATVVGAAILPEGLALLTGNLAILFGMLLVFTGIGVVHAMARSKGSLVALFVFYFAFVVLSWIAVTAVILVGIIDQWTGLRRRFLRTSSDTEDE